MTPYHKQSQTLRLIRFLQLHPGATFSIAYALLTLCGVYYSSSFFAEFDVPILKLATISDMLLVGLSEPAALLTFAGGSLVALLTDWVFQRSYDTYQKWKEKPSGLIRTLVIGATYVPKTNNVVMAYCLAIFALYSLIFVTVYGESKGQQIKQGNSGKQVIVHADTIPQTPVVFLGTTSTFVVVYDAGNDTSHIIPIEAVSSIRPVSKTNEGATVKPAKEG